MTSQDRDGLPAGAAPDFCPGDDELAELGRSMLNRLSSTIEGDIIPRLMMAFEGSVSRDSPVAPARTDLADSIDEFVRLVLDHDASVANEYVATLRRDGIPLPALYLDLLAPTARRLGQMWESDECSFVDVTLGLCRMHEVLLEFSRCFDPPEAPMASGRNALIVPAPGEQHTFGLFMVLEFFRRAGWNCYTGTPATTRDFDRLARSQDFAMIGISVSADRHLPAAAEQIARIRRLPNGDQAVVLVGGRAFTEHPERATEIGADAVATDAEDAVRKVRSLCGSTHRQPPV